MGNFLFAYNFVPLIASMLTLSSEDTNYGKANMLDLSHLKRHSRTLVQTEVTIVINFAVAKAVKSVLLNDVNFTSVTIQGNATDSWGSPSFTQNFVITKDERVQRYKLYAALTAFNYKYMRIKIPVQTPTDLSVFRIGTIVCTLNTLTFTRNPDFPYDYEASYPKPLEVEFLCGSKEQVSQGENKIWIGNFAFMLNEKINEPELWTLDILKPTDYMVFFENGTDLSKCYLCKKNSALRISWDNPKRIKTNGYELIEVI